MAGTVVILGTFDIGASDRDRAADLFEMMNVETRKEPGCEYYAFSADLHDGNRFHLSEIWTDAAALDEHMRTPHMATFMATLPDLDCTREVTKWDATSVPLR